MKFSRREKYLLGALAALIVFAPALNLMASTPPSQVMFGPGQPVTLTGATAAAPGASVVGGVSVDTVNTLTNGYLFQVNNSGSDKFHIDFAGVVTRSTTGDAKTCTATTAACDTVTANALTTGQAISIPHTTSVLASGGSLLALSSTSVDTGTTTGNLLDLSASGSVASVLASIRASNASQTTETALSVVQSGTTASYTGDFVAFTGSSTTGTGDTLKVTGVNTTAGTALAVVGNAATTTNASAESISATAITTGAALKINTSGSGTMTNAGAAIQVNDAAVNTFRLGVDGHLTFLQNTAPVVTNSGGSVISCTDGAGTAAKCTDTRGIAVATTSASTNPIVITFHTPFAIAPVCVVTPADATTETDFVSSTIKPVATVSASAISITPAANWAVTAHKFNYICME